MLLTIKYLEIRIIIYEFVTGPNLEAMIVLVQKNYSFWHQRSYVLMALFPSQYNIL